jgi:pyridoxine/pyridoxamine 5'-phosphate oxidase
MSQTLSLPVLSEFIRRCGFAVISTTAKNGAPEAALVNIAATDDLELVFHALDTTRKCANLRRDRRIAAVIGGWHGEQTLQYEGTVDEPDSPELERLIRLYFERPTASGQGGWPGLVYFRVRPKWLRFSSYGRSWSVEEHSFK